MTSYAAVWEALSSVRDPELDRPITSLGFVASVTVAGEIRVELRLPTYFCAPNFAWLMVADARDAVAALPGAAQVTVVLLEHFVSAEINEGVAAVSGFAAKFDADGLDPDLESLRTTFERKAHLAAQERLARKLAPQVPDLTAVTMAAAARLAPAEASAVARRRSRVGITSEFALCGPSGERLTEADLPGWLRFARTVRVSIEGNAGFCQGLLRTRYNLDSPAA
nr:iron-sulfur cluster assembly protein [uncultured Actinoplanes sp.]